jgi:Secretion system C-terminal sorting domain
MKIITLLLLMVTGIAIAQDVYIPDTILKAKLTDTNQGIDENGDGEIQYAEALAVTDTLYLAGNGANGNHIVNLTGIEAFENITGLDVSNNNIETFNCLNAHLKYLDVKFNNLTGIQVNNCGELTMLSCNNNQLTAIDISNCPELSVLYCGNNSLAALNVAANTALTVLHCATNNLTELDISQNTNLESLYCFYNNITTLNLASSPALTLLSCGYNPGLTGLDFTNTPLLVQLNCIQTAVTSLNLSMCPQLRLLVCTGCSQLENINIKNNYNHFFSEDHLYLSDLPLLETVCVDNTDSEFSSWVAAQTLPGVIITSTCTMGTDVDGLENVSVFPNPANTIVYIEGAEISEVCVFNSMGQKAGFYKNTGTVDLSAMPAGVYFLYIKDVYGATIVKKVIKNI